MASKAQVFANRSLDREALDGRNTGNPPAPAGPIMRNKANSRRHESSLTAF
jgi:hypothetical protein